MISAFPPAESANVKSITRYLGVTGFGLWALVMTLQPDPGFAAPWSWMALFWALQIGAGLAVLQTVLYLMSRVDRLGRVPLWLLIIFSGLTGAALLAPLYWLIGEGLMQFVLGFPATIDGEHDLDPQLAFGVSALVQEYGEIVGPVTASWALISWPRLQGLLPPLLLSAQPPRELPRVSSPSPSSQSFPEIVEASALCRWRAALPAELGDDLIAVTSELQYLRVWTARGCALVLGTLQEVEDSEAAAGMRVHRSWWVHARHVRSVRRRGDGAICELSDGREVPVSRRRKAEVIARFGDGVRYEAAASPSTLNSDEQDQNMRRNPS